MFGVLLQSWPIKCWRHFDQALLIKCYNLSVAFKKTLLLFLFFLLLAIPIDWFAFAAPVASVTKTLNEAPKIVNSFINEAFPQDLVIDIKNGQVSVNQPLPYCLVLDKPTKSGVLFDENPQPLTLLDPKASPYSLLCKPIALVGKNFVVYEDKNEGSYKIYKLPEEMTYRVTQAELQKLSSDWLPKILPLAKILYFSAPFLFAPFVLGWFLFINLWYALVAKLAFRLFKIDRDLTFKEAYSKTLPALLVWTAFDWIIIGLFINHLAKLQFSLTFPFLGTIVVVAGAVLLEKYYLGKRSEEIKS